MAKTSEAEDLRFDDLPDSKQNKSIDTAGIHRNMKLVEIEYQPKKEKTKKEKGTDKEVGTGEFTGPWVKFIFHSTPTAPKKEGDPEEPVMQFTYTMFEPPTRPEDVKICMDKYEKGVAIRKNTPEEQIRQDFNNRFYFYEQLAKAWIVSPEKFNNFKKSLKGSPEVLFKEMFDTFFAAFPMEKNQDKPIDIKLIWNNNDKKRTSFLTLAYPGATNLVFAPYIPERPTMLSLTKYEEGLVKRKFSMHDRAPGDNNTETGGDLPKEGAWQPHSSTSEDSGGGGASNKVKDDEPLF